MTAWRHYTAPIAAMGRLVTMVTIKTTHIEIINQELLNPEDEGTRIFRNVGTTIGWF
jgi:hypothetical protein